MKRVVLTGGTGFVGANLVRRLLNDGHEVHLLVRTGHASWRIDEIRSAVELHEVDLLDAASVSGVIGGIKPAWVFHFAAHGAYSWQTDPIRIAQSNILGTINLVAACLDTGFESFIHSGSSSEYGYKDHAPGEGEFLDPNSYYAVTKASATMFCRYAAHHRHANITTLRLYSVYGPYEDPNRLIPTLIRYGLNGNLPPLVDPKTARDYIHVEDVCDACLLVAGTPPPESGSIYNLGTGVQTTLEKVVETARRIMHIPAEPQFGSMERRSWDTSVWVADNRKLCREMNWTPRVNIEDGLRRTVEWYRGSGSWALAKR